MVKRFELETLEKPAKFKKLMGKVTPVKFMQESRNVLEKVDSIYKLEFLGT
ncbi:hypothetical protein YDYSY3_27860 [Paenibacillus chitinolyticus]|nr:hypothetical protein YDYSY3_27860 [Paenibacillus chitinolyticus]